MRLARKLGSWIHRVVTVKEPSPRFLALFLIGAVAAFAIAYVIGTATVQAL